MGEGSIWVGTDEHEGVLAQPRKDLKPPPHWRLEAVARTPRPRSLTIAGDRRSAVMIEDAETSDVWLLDLEAGGAPERLTTGRDPMPYWEDVEPRLSPDGETVAYADEGHVWLVPVAGGPPRKLVEGSSPVWTPDGRIVIGVERDDTSRLAVVDADDAWPRRLATSHGDLDAYGDEGDAAVSPDGTEVAYMFWPREDLKRGEIRVAAIDGGAVRSVASVPGMMADSPAWSPDGSTIAYRSESSGFHELHLVGSDGSGERRLTSAEADHSQAEWHPDGDRLVAVRGRRNRFDLVVVNASDGSAEVVAEGGTWSYPHWTAAGGIVAAYEDHATAPELRTAEPGGAGAHDPRPGAARDPLGAPRRARGRGVPHLRRARDPGLPHAPARRGDGQPRAGGRLPARRPDRRLHGRLGRPRPVLRGPRATPGWP